MVGQHVYVQEQTGTNKGKWLKSGTIIDNVGHKPYYVKLDGSGRITKRRRQFIKPLKTVYHTRRVNPVDTGGGADNTLADRIYNLRHKMS